MNAISVVILTLNEEINLGDCIDSCGWCDDIVVFDSFSTDRTREIAQARGVRFFQRTFDDYARQRNAALTGVTFKHPWVLMVDADERTPPGLVAEMQSAVASADAGTAMFRMRRKDFFLGRWLKRSSGYPTWFGRLMRVGHVRIEREINEEYVTDGKVAHLQEHLLHHPFNKGVAYWYERHIGYAALEAAAKIRMAEGPLAWRPLLSGDPIDRRRALKRVTYRLPLRPLLYFLYLYVYRLGFLDGLAGLTFSRMRASYELIIDVMVLELKAAARAAATHPPTVTRNPHSQVSVPPHS